MIDDSIMDKIIPLPTEEEKMNEIQQELEAEGFTITNFKKGGIFYTIIRIFVAIFIELKSLARTMVNSSLMKHAEGEDWVEIKAADYSKYRKPAKKAKGYITIYRSEYTQALAITKGHMFKTTPDVNGKEKKYFAINETIIDAGSQIGKVLVEAESEGTEYNINQGRITVSMIHLEGVERVTNEADWLYEEGTDIEDIEKLRERCLNSYSEAAERTTEQKLKGVVESVNGVIACEINAQHPRGQGTTDIIITGSAGEATQTLIEQVTGAINSIKGNYDDFLVKSSSSILQDFELIVYLAEDASTDGVDEQVKNIIQNMMSMNRKELNKFYTDSIIKQLSNNITDYRTTTIIKPTQNIVLEKENVLVLGTVTVTVQNVESTE